jgi:esterase/lipase superfamily enzyme
VPKDHRVGELEAPSYFRLEFTEDAAKHVILSRVAEKSASDFYNEVHAKVAASKGRSAFVFVHGYNVTFSDAARRTAQMSYDLKFDGAPVFFSWPSQGSLLGYTVDEANIEYARSDLKTFIAEFARTSTADNIYLVAHSMGNRALTGAIADLFREAPDVKARIREIILAAPDIDADVFKRDIAPAISGQGQAVTLYASSNDWALRASKKFHGYARAGDTGQALTVVPGIATIDSSEVETDFLGHSYFAESTSIIADMFDILSGVTNPEDRRHLVPVEAHVGRYWKIPKVSD